MKTAISLVLFACLLVGFGHEVWKASHKTPSTYQAQRADETKRHAESVTPADSGVADKTHSTDNRDHNATDKGWLAGFFEVKLTDLLIAIFTGVLAWKTSGLFRETAGLRSAADKQARDFIRSIKASEKSADAASLNAEALMNAEGAALYPVIVKTNVKEVFQGPILHDKMPGDTPTPTPTVRYCFKNFGRTPAVFESAMHGIRFIPEGAKTRVMSPIESPLEIIMSEKTSGDITCQMSGESFNFEKAKSVLKYEGALLFFGEVFFRDFFDRRFQCYWEFDGRPDGFHFTKIQQRPDPDAERQRDPRTG